MVIRAKTDETVFLLSNREKSNCLGLRVEMIDDIDGTMLQKAVDLTMSRYSYLNVRFVEKVRPYYVENNAPYKVLHVTELPELGGPDTNYHLLAFTYSGKTVTLHFFHGLLDGTGVFTIARTLVYYYAKLRYDPGLSSEGIITLETPVNPNESADAYFLAKTIPVPRKVLRAPDTKRTGKVFRMSDSRLIPKNDQCHKLFHIRVSAEEIMEVCRANEISPSLLVSVILANSIRKLHPEAKDIVGGLTVNARRCLNNIETLKLFVVAVKLKFTGEMSRLPFDVQCTICRGKVLLNTENDVLLAAALEMTKLLSILYKIPYLKATKQFMHKVFANMIDDTFQVSYTGQSNFGAAEKYVNSVLLDYDTPARTISVEMTAVGDRMFLSFGQKWEATCYLDSFLEELHRHGIHTEIIEEKQTRVPNLYSVFY